MLNKQTQLELTDLMQEQFTDLDIYREKPFTFKAGELLLVVKPVPFFEHDKFLTEMAALVLRYYEIFNEIDFLNSHDYKDKDAVKTLLEKILIFSAGKMYKHFKRDSAKFISKWAYVSKIKKEMELRHNKKLARRFLNNTEPSEFIYILFLLFVYNFDIVKKNTIEFFQMFRNDIEIHTRSGISSKASQKRVVAMPKYQEEPYNKSQLEIFAEQSQTS